MATTGCGQRSAPRVYEYVTTKVVIPEERRAEAARWIIDTVNAANPKSDEEPEDNIAQAEKTADRLFGQTSFGVAVGTQYNIHFIPLSQCGPRHRAMIETYLAGKGNP